MINTNYRNKKRRTKSKFVKLGYWGKVVINGQEMYVRDASEKYPRELFALVEAKEVMLAQRVYMNLLDCIRVLDFASYQAYRLPYHEKVVCATTKKWHRELDLIVRNKLKNEYISSVKIVVKGKSRTYHSLGNPIPDKSKEINCSTSISRTYIKHPTKSDFTQLIQINSATLN
jgi:hypothetical protein